MKRKCFVVFRHFHKNFSEIFRIFSRSAGIPFLSLPFCIRACRKVPVCRSAEKCGFLRLLCEFSLIPMQNMIYLGCILPTPNAPGQRVFSRCAAPFFLGIRQYSCEKMSCSTQKFLAAGHIGSFQIHPGCRLERQFGQWFRWSLPAFSGVQSLPQTLQVNVS